MNITNDKLMEILERNLGLPMGDGGIFYIEDPGQKRINKIYFSKTNMSLYKCTADNTDVTVTGNFKLYSLSNTDDYLGALTGVDRGQVKYIQDVGTKYVDKVYIDRPTGKLYRCVTQTSSVNNDANFVENNLKSTDDRYSEIFVRLYTIQGTTQIESHFLNATEARTHFIHIPKMAKRLRLIQTVAYLTHPTIDYTDKIFKISDLKVGDRFGDGGSSRSSETELIIHGENEEYYSAYFEYVNGGSPSTTYDNTHIIEVSY